MDTIKTETETKMTEAYELIANVIRSYEPDRLDENTVESFKFMLECDTFAPIHKVLADKILEIGEYIKKLNDLVVRTDVSGKPVDKPKRTPDTRKRRKKSANGNDLPDCGWGMTFVQKDGILVPVQK